ncbi:Type IV inositol polyphosphate 5-phosphatase 11 [Dichanthelium oligosanthes]|uniref:Type IV inositol polyphosphate 5-phosphatase 11 n=1 Tax=Dichanthelium oligosanthes TaxID=888268 RepID=A0A1E5VW99_9POAL|nr:Type IV inositol polyphosphate 5-phosphatase 11 [Dichanthelium oligosanthes]
MGNCSSLALPKWRSHLQNNSLVSIDESGTHDGIKTIPIQKACEFTTNSVLCVCIITWNMNGKMSVEDITKLVRSNRKFDLLVVGLQEAPKCDVSQVLQETMADTHILLGQKSMQSLQMLLFGSKSSEKFIRAHERKVEKRNSEFQHISRSLFSKYGIPYAQSAAITVWLGDLNYRVGGISSIPARKMIEENHQSKLRGRDQLLQEAEKGEVFNGYYEGTLSFKPTYKYDVGSSIYDTSHKIRVPSWTDRVLFKVDHSSGLDAVLSSYESLDCVRSSDHKPVKAHLCLKVRNEDD